MLPCGSRAENTTDRGRRQMKIQKAHSRDLDLLAPIAQIKPREDICGQLPRVHFPSFGYSNQGIGLIIAKLRIWTGLDMNGSCVNVGKDLL